MSSIVLSENLYPPDHPYHWPVIGSMEDLSAARYEDVVEFFKKYYTPGNASLVVAGDINPKECRALVTKWFSDVPASKPVLPMGKPLAFVAEEKRLVLEDKVQLPRLSMNWLTPPEFAPGDADLQILANIIAGGKNSRLYKRLVYDLQIAQDVYARQGSSDLCSQFSIVATARSGHTLTELEGVMREEIARMKSEPPTTREVQRTINQYEAGFLDALENPAGKADELNHYYAATGNPDYFNEDLARYKALDARAIQCAAERYLRDGGCVLLSVVPQGKRELAATGKKEGK
jgi:zinc protease